MFIKKIKSAVIEEEEILEKYDLLVKAAAPKSDARPASATLLEDNDQVS